MAEEVTGVRVSRFLVNRDFARLWYGQAVSSIGDYVFDTTLTLWIATELLAHSHWAPAAVSGLMLCAFLATMVVGPMAGVFVDRWSLRRTLLRSEVIRGLVVGTLALITLLPTSTLPVGVWLILLYAVVLVVNSAGQFFNPARFATIGEIVEGEADRAKAFGLGQATAATAVILGPPIAAPLLFALGIKWAMFINCASYVVSYLAIRSVRFPAADATRTDVSAADRTPWRTQFADGIKMFARNRFLIALLAVMVISSLGTGALTALMVFFVTDNLHVSAGLLGILWMAYGAGAVSGSLISGRLTRLLHARNVTWLGLIFGGAGIAALSRQTHYSVAVALMFVMAIPVAVMNAGISPQLLAVTPKEFTGRMMGVLSPIVTAASMISVVVAGSLASTTLRDFHATVLGLHLGRIDTIFLTSAALILCAGIYAYFALPPTTVASVS
ncbi:Na+/melibiose symporter-like transporter [Kribbella voronezhensis]|uniref:Na+/melibiose symporter-like transporter n=1 Tax=Kribbella voronezhensis TaxID=2512212 RepID=A0A4R7TAQ8_9ACTN|nr:MFS transporter [Kribbella voronezhensis]TDU89094.1 Na+/melibiose symporter-like transporter [Kribbella voronezhensis]